MRIIVRIYAMGTFLTNLTASYKIRRQQLVFMVHIEMRPTPEKKQEAEYEPDWLRIRGQPDHIWFNNTHLIEVSDRNVEVGKYYLGVNGEMLFQRVLTIDDVAVDGSIPSHIDDVEKPLQKITVEIIYEAGNNDPIPENPAKEVVPRYVLETEEAVNMGDISTTPFKLANDV